MRDTIYWFAVTFPSPRNSPEVGTRSRKELAFSPVGDSTSSIHISLEGAREVLTVRGLGIPPSTGFFKLVLKGRHHLWRLGLDTDQEERRTRVSFKYEGTWETSTRLSILSKTGLLTSVFTVHSEGRIL